MNPKVSVIVPCYNGATWLPTTLDSILRQTFRDFELLCVNDGSTDQTLTVFQTYAARDPRIKVIDKPHTGAADSRNVGLEQSVGTYVFFLDADDYFLETFIEKMVTTLETEQSDLVVCGSDEFNHVTKQPLRFRNFHYLDVTKPITTVRIDEIYPYLFNFSETCAWTRIFKHSIIDQYQIRFQNDTDGAADDLFFVQYYTLQCQKLSIIREILIHHRANLPSSLSSLNNPKVDPWGHVKAPELLRAHIPDDLYPLVKDSYLNLYYKTTCHGVRRANYRQGKAIFKHARQVLKHAKLRKSFAALNYYGFGLKINCFPLVYWLLKRVQKQENRKRRQV